MSREPDENTALLAWLVVLMLAMFAVAAIVHAQQADGLTEIDQLRIQVAVLTKQSCDLAVERAVSQTQAAIMAAHPGFRWNPETGALVKMEAAK